MTVPTVLLKTLTDARDLLRTGWTQGVMSRDTTGTSTAITHGTGPAICWCAYGAVRHAAANHLEAFPVRVLEWVLNQTTPPVVYSSTAFSRPIEWSLIGWNDEPERTLQQVLDLFDLAIEWLKTNPDYLFDVTKFNNWRSNRHVA